MPSLGSLASSFARMSYSHVATKSPTVLRSMQPCASRSIHMSLHRPSLAASARPMLPTTLASTPSRTSVRHRSQLAPRRVKYRKAHKGRVPIPSGGSLKGTTIREGMYGIRLLAPARLSAKQLTSAETALTRKLKVVKGAQVFMRVFPDIPVCVKGNETRMGKGKGAFEYWACR